MGFILGVVATIICLFILIIGMNWGYEMAIDKAKRGDVVTAYGKHWKLTLTEVEQQP